MSNSEHSSETPSRHLPKWLIFAFIIVSFIGFLDASYLTIAHYTGLELRCSIFNGCQKVTTSEYSTVFGFPVALLGVFYYLSILLLSLFYFDTKKKKILKYIMPLTAMGILASAWFVYVQIFALKSICQYCMISAGTSTLLFIFGFITYKKYGKITN